MNVRRRHLISGSAAAATTALALGTLSACTSAGAAAGGGKGTYDVVASFYPMAFLAERIGGDHVHVTSLTQPGQEPHDLEISARQTARLEESDAVLYLKGLQPSVDGAVAQSGIKTKIDAASLTTLEEHGNEVGGHAAAHDTHPGEENGGKDPHVWLDPVRYAQVAQGVGKAFEKGDPAHAADYRKNTAALVKELDALNTRYETGLRNTRSKVFITTHAAFGYLAERYGLTEEAIKGLDPESEPSAARVRDLERMTKADGVTTVFYETLVSDRTARTVAGDAGLRTDVLDPIEGITAKSRGTDYLQVMDSNLQALRKALGAK
ncbi:metal ABC transporter substrate-binding protein [Streptomyces naganishii]|uniref:Zinc ABC transporter substrate-binding protein n=1 Tax=Streptomyces naganishii JCM 4654 TaxID=1306179 RepID=A0A918Y6G3_9ACTN|nr:metal ABC transporter substrate-binding protein [Streptomyces naganishii]GHD92369.1 zinc ABC transporter substrate-binding protein [Streptomyces naganishii JCM 4654]